MVLFSYGQFQTEQERKEYANNLFEQGEFIEAEPHMLHFLSLENSTEYSYKYGVCALYTYADKSKAIRFLKFAVKDREVDVKAFFYLGKAYHLNYLFNDAIRNYELFKSNSTSKIQKEFLIEMHLSMCVSGKSLMQNLTDLVVEDKIESSLDRFQYSYDFSKIGGRILVTDEFQSKYDKKVGYRSVIYFPPLNQNLIFFSSYGKDGANGLDLYKVYRLAEGGWSEPIRLPSHINTPYDDAFPFLHSDGKTFYFSSMGHSSMGGYDIFRTFFEEETNSFGPPSNMDYKINTPSDDIMYVVDSLNQNAFFSSSRASKGDFLDVYKVRVEVFPIQNVIIAGEFFNEIDNTDLDAKIQIIDLITEEVIGIFHPNDQRKYTIILPKSGKYKFLVETPKSESIHAGMVEVMPQKELKLLKQEILLASNDGNEQLIIKNLFDETVENESEILAEVLRELSTPEINFDEFPDSLFIEDLSLEEELIVTDSLNFNEDVDLVSISNEIALEARNEADEIENKMNASFLVAQKKSDESKAASKQAQEILKNIDEIENPLERQQQADLANEYHERSKELNQQAVTAINVANSLKTQYDKKEKEAVESQEIANEISKAIQDDSHDEALAHLSELQNKINDIIEEDSEINYSIDNKETQAKSLELKAKEHLSVGQELREEEELIQVKLANAKREKNTAKKQKDKDEIQLKINQFEEELALNNQMADDEFSKYEQLINDSKNINAEVEMLAELDEIVETNPNVEISDEQKEIVEQQVLSDDVSQGIKDNEKLLSEIPDKNTLTENENLETNEVGVDEDISLINQSENIQNETEVNSNEQEIAENNNDQTVNDDSSNELINKQQEAYKEVVAVLENSESTNYDYSDSFNESITFNSKSSTEKIESIENDLEMLMVAKQELASLEYENQNEVKESKKVETQKDIDNKKEIISEMETNLSSSFEGVMIAEKQNNDSLFSSVEDVLSPELLVDEDFLSAKYYNDQAQKQYVLAENLKKEAQNQTNNNKKAELLREAHQYELAAVENQQDALNLLDEIEVPTQIIDVAQENENSAEIDETPIDNSTQETVEENTAGSNSTETNEQELSSESENRTEVTNDATFESASQENFNSNAKTQEVVKQTVAGEDFESDSDPEIYQVAAVFSEDSPITIDNYSNSFSKNKLQTVQQEVNEVVELEKEISVLNKELAATEDEKQIKKIAKKIESLKAEKIQNELELADVYKEVNQSELEIAKVKVDVVKEQSMAFVNNSYEFKQAQEYEKAGDVLEEKAIVLRKEAENESDFNKKNELLLKASNAELSALDKLETAKKLYAEALVEDVSVSSAISPKQLNTSFTSSEVAIKANDVNENALLKENRAVELRADAENAKSNEKSALLNEATKLEELAKEEKALANQLFNKANRIKLYEDAIVEQQDLAANLSEADAAQVVTTKEYEEYYNQELEINELSTQLRTIEEESNAYDALFKQQTTKANSYFNKALSEQDPQKRQDYISKAKELKENALTNKSKADEIQEEVVTLAKEVKKKKVAQAQVISSLDRETANDIKAVVISDYNKAPKSEIVSINDLASTNYKAPSEVKSDIFVVSKQTTYSVNNPIPVNPPHPEGLIFKVQVGAFRRPIPQDLFKGFAPISAEKVRDDITRYRVGYFKNENTATSSRNTIRGLGYRDAFVVAIYNGERIPISEARNLIVSNPQLANNSSSEIEDEISIPKNNELQTSNNSINSSSFETNTATETTENITVDNNEIANETPEYIANLNENSAEVSPVENIKGLFYSIQIGAFSKPLSKDDAFNVTPLVIQYVNNLYKYSTGIFNTIEDAKLRKIEMNGIGLSDAFVVAFFDGNRVSIARSLELAANEKPVINKTEDNGVTVLPANLGKEYYVNLGIFNDSVPKAVSNALLSMREFRIKPVSIGEYRQYLSGVFKTLEKANLATQTFKEIGIKDAEVIEFIDGKVAKGQPKAYKGLFYTIHLGTYYEKVPRKLRDVFMRLDYLDIETKKSDQQEDYYASKEDLYSDAEEILKDCLANGVVVSKIVAFKDGVEIDVDVAKQFTRE